MRVFAGTNGDKATEIKGFGESIGAAATNYFGGIFASEDPEVALSHGANLQEFEVNNVMDLGELKHSVFYEEGGYELAKDAVSEHIHWADDEEVEHLIDVALEEEDPNEETAEILKEPSEYEVGWYCQGLAGVIAKAFGADAVCLPDEHGCSLLVLPGAKIL